MERLSSAHFGLKKLHCDSWLHAKGCPLICHMAKLTLSSMWDGARPKVVRVIDCEHFAWNEFRSQSITHSRNALYLWSHLATLSTYLQPNPILAQISLTITMCTLNCDIPSESSWMPRFVAHFHMYYMKMLILFSPVDHIWPSKTIKSLSLWLFSLMVYTVASKS